MYASPPLGESTPVSMYIAVVLPAPLCPRMVKISPSLMDKLSLLTAVKLPNFLVSLSSKIGSFLSKNLSGFSSSF
jgi:hypothetical protein